jgi:hypothetical protein
VDLDIAGNCSVDNEPQAACGVRLPYAVEAAEVPRAGVHQQDASYRNLALF